MKIPYGNADFEKIRKNGLFYVDKTRFLPELESHEFGYSNLIFLRPRRFGKSSLVSMMEHYYDRSRADHFDELFRGLWIHDHPTPEKNKYLVLKFDFSQMGLIGTQEQLDHSFLEVTRGAVKSMILRYKDRIPELARFESALDNYRYASDLMTNLLGIVAGIGEEIYVLIDEYDTFSNDMLSAGHKSLYSTATDQSGLVRAFYRTLKAGSGSGAIARVFITGGAPILLDDIMTGFNIVTNISLEPRFNTLAGFTKADVGRAVDELLIDRPDLSAIEGIGDRAKLIDVLETFFDGYRFSEDAAERIFNSTMVLYFLRELARYGKYPKQMLDPNARTDYHKLHSLWATVGPEAEERRQALEQLLDEGHVWSMLVEQFGQRSAPTSAQFVSLMYYTGMLTLSTEAPRGRQIRFELPNRVVRDLGWEHFVSLLRDLDGVELRTNAIGASIYEMAASGDINPFLELLRTDVLTVLGTKDMRKYSEKSMKMLLIGTILMSGIFHILSEKEFARGYNDLFLSPHSLGANGKYAWMIELKYLPATADAPRVEATMAKAEAQLRRYLSDKHLVDVLSANVELNVGTLLFKGCSDVEWRPLPRESV